MMLWPPGTETLPTHAYVECLTAACPWATAFNMPDQKFEESHVAADGSVVNRTLVVPLPVHGCHGNRIVWISADGPIEKPGKRRHDSVRAIGIVEGKRIGGIDDSARLAAL